MGRKEYEFAAKQVRDFRADCEKGYFLDREAGDMAVERMEKAFVDMFNHFDSKGRFDQKRFLAACKVK